MKTEIKLTKTDWKKFNGFIQKKKQNESKGLVNGFWGNLILWFFIGIGGVFILNTAERLHYPTALFVSIIFIFIISQSLWNMAKLSKALMPSPEGVFVGTHHFTFDEEGIHSEGSGYKSFHEWKTVKNIEHENGMVMIFIDTAHAFLFPEEQLENTNELLKIIYNYKV